MFILSLRGWMDTIDFIAYRYVLYQLGVTVLNILLCSRYSCTCLHPTYWLEPCGTNPTPQLFCKEIKIRI